MTNEPPHSEDTQPEQPPSTFDLEAVDLAALTAAVERLWRQELTNERERRGGRSGER